jgi:hypothetical protein
MDCEGNGTMTLTIEIPEELAAALQAKAQAEGISPDSYVGRVLETTLPVAQPEPIRLPLKTGYGMLAKCEPAPSDEDIAGVCREIADEANGSVRLPLKTGRGMWAKHGPAPSAEEIDENRREMLTGFARH